MTVIKSDKILLPDGIASGYVSVHEGKIIAVTHQEPDSGVTYDYTGKYVSPGFIDLHTHGAGGHSFTDSSPEEVAAGCNVHLTHGTTTILPTGHGNTPCRHCRRQTERSGQK